LNKLAVSFAVELSIVIPLLNEAESLPELTRWIQRVLTARGLSYEVILIDDGSTDDSWVVIEALASQDMALRGIRFNRNYGKSAALNVGFNAARGRVVCTMDADLQDSPEELPELYRMIIEDDYDLISGWKQKRYDPLSKTIPTKLFNGATRAISGIQLHDFNCGLKAYDQRVVKSIEVYGEMHRYIPVIATPGAQIWRNQIWAGALYLWFSRPSQYHVRESVPAATHALFRYARQLVVFHWHGAHAVANGRESVAVSTQPTCAQCDRPTAVFSFASGCHYWRTAISGRFSG
jgi:glycosyltransferase involved in cell wall biosynthesis